jgi:hypothetical protein
VSVDTKRRLDSAGFKPYQQRVPGLLIPVHDTSGAVALWQYRPDKPRENGNGKPVKYETPGGSRMVMDVPPRVRAQLGDPTVPLWVTEGVKKADAAVSAGLACVALLGVWNWKGTNTLGGKTALPAWADIALNGRPRVRRLRLRRDDQPEGARRLKSRRQMTYSAERIPGLERIHPLHRSH